MLSVSEPLRRRGASVLVRVYIEARASDPSGTGDRLPGSELETAGEHRSGVHSRAGLSASCLA